MKKTLILFLAVMLMLVFSCSNSEDTDQVTDPVDELDIPDGFDYSLQKEVKVQIALHEANGDGIPGVVYDLYYVDINGENQFIRKNMTNTAGYLHTILTLPTYVENVMISGFMNSIQLAISNNEVEYSYNVGGNTRDYQPADLIIPEATRDFSYVDGLYYDYDGVPYPHDYYPITAEMLVRVDTSLPESVSLLQTHPQYLGPDVETNFIISDSSDVWITFVTEGAGYKNGLGYYTYDQEEGAPEDPSSLEHILIFPNASLEGEGGGLEPGMQIYLGRFGAGTVMGWFLVQNGWVEGDIVDENALRFYSDNQYNPEDEEYHQHQVLLYDDEAELFLIAFDDQVRPGGDQDFNDAVFFATANPIEHIVTDNIEPIDIPVDRDNDGVNDPFDDYPDDNQRAFRIYYPSENQFSSLVFEDKWPAYGDYDMNDMVMDYRYMLVTNADDEIKDLKMEFRFRAAGAFYNNGFSVLLPFDDTNIYSNVSSDNISPLNVAEGDFTIVDFFDAASQLTGLSAGAFFNTEPGENNYEAIAFSDSITLINPVPLDGLDFSFPFDPFLRRQGDLNHEIHLMNYPSTSRHNVDLFTAEDDDSNPDQGSYYVSPSNLPWGLNLPESWKYPIETEMITDSYIHFGTWAESGGSSHQDWYIYIESNVNEELIYQIP